MKRTILIISGIVVLAVLLAGAAFVAGRMWVKEAPPDETLAESLPIIPPEGASSGETMMMKLEPAEELPQRAPEVLGIFSRREDNRIFVNSSGQGIILIHYGQAGTDANVTEVEVVVTNETTVYEDITAKTFSDGSPSGGTVQQQVKPGSVEAIGENSIVSAWGERRGDRLVADFLVYTGPLEVGR